MEHDGECKMEWLTPFWIVRFWVRLVQGRCVWCGKSLT